jgi:hypothetical protein
MSFISMARVASQPLLRLLHRDARALVGTSVAVAISCLRIQSLAGMMLQAQPQRTLRVLTDFPAQQAEALAAFLRGLAERVLQTGDWARAIPEGGQTALWDAVDAVRDAAWACATNSTIENFSSEGLRFRV